MPWPDDPEVVGPKALADFRRGLTGAAGLRLLEEYGGRALFQLPVGVGKSTLLDAMTVEALESGRYDLVLVLCPTRRLIAERGPLLNPPPGVRVVDVRPRPADRCGTDRDAAWRALESRDLGALGRLDLCGICPLRPECFWPDQYGAGLEGARLVYATQAHLELNPAFPRMIRERAGAANMLVLLDESDFLARDARVRVDAADLERFAAALGDAEVPPNLAAAHDRWASLVGLLREASTADLQAPGWHFPRLAPAWTVAVQRSGVRLFGESFRFSGFILAEFGGSPIDSRRRADSGAVEFARRLVTDGDLAVFSGTADPGFVAYRLGEALASPLARYRFHQTGTRWLNLASRIGARRYFRRNAPQILDAFARLTARRAAQGRRVLLVTRKCFAADIATDLRARFAGLGADLRVVAEGYSGAELADPRTVPLITYGMIGTNLFEHFDCVYCLNGYYVNEAAVDACLQDVVRGDLRIPIALEADGRPPRRRARAARAGDRFYDVAHLAQAALEHKEHHVVLQAVGRVRPFTRPREVITFQMAELPGVTYDAEFTSLGGLRDHLGLPTTRAARVADLRRAGLTQRQIAETLGVTDRTVRAFTNRRTGNEPY